MLSKKDLESIRTIIQEELKEALTCEVQYEKFDKERGMKELKTEKWFLPEWLMYHQPELIGAIRGMQADVGKTNNRILDISNLISTYTFVPDDTKKIIKEEVIQIEIEGNPCKQ